LWYSCNFIQSLISYSHTTFITVSCAFFCATSRGADFNKGLAAYQSGDYVTALREFRPLAEDEHACAQHHLGFMYAKGEGVPQDDKTAVKWYTLAAEQGYAGAQTNLGLMYYTGRGVLQDYVYAHMWLHIAATSGYKKASQFRDTAAKKLTSAEIAKAEKLASECVAKKYKGC
jgi:hypothetical protein